jgi:hypothetical protein
MQELNKLLSTVGSSKEGKLESLGMDNQLKVNSLREMRYPLSA